MSMFRSRTLALSTALLLVLASSTLFPVQASPVTASLLASSDTPNNRQERRDDRRDDRSDRQDTRQDCRNEEGLMGGDKRDCKQEERRDSDVEPVDSQ